MATRRPSFWSLVKSLVLFRWRAEPIIRKALARARDYRLELRKAKSEMHRLRSVERQLSEAQYEVDRKTEENKVLSLEVSMLTDWVNTWKADMQAKSARSIAMKQLSNLDQED